METKREIRRAALARRDAMSLRERRAGDVLVTERLLGHQLYYRAGTLLVFVSYGSEIDTGMIMEDAWRSGKVVYAPKVEGREIKFYRVRNYGDVSAGFRGIREPSGVTEPFVYREEEAADTLMAMPGAAFDGYRNRVGYGGGFYDRFLADKPALPTAALGYRCQLVPRIPAEPFDVRPWQVLCL